MCCSTISGCLAILLWWMPACIPDGDDTYLARLQSAFLMGRGCHSEMNQWCPTLSNHQVSTVAPCLYHHSQRSHQSSEFANATALLAQDFTSPPRQWWKVELWVTKQVIKRVLNKYTPITTVSDGPENYCGSSKRMKKYFCKTWWHSIIPCRKRFWFVPCFKHDCQARPWVESLLHVNMWRAEKERHLNFYRHTSITSNNHPRIRAIHWSIPWYLSRTQWHQGVFTMVATS